LRINRRVKWREASKRMCFSLEELFLRWIMYV